jgi:hypothetical protein
MEFFVRSPDALFTEVDGELVALDAARGLVFGLNSTASAVWRLIETPTSLDQICAALVDEYEVDQATCRHEVGEVMRALLCDGLATKRASSAR